jgi:hypothetical protein
MSIIAPTRPASKNITEAKCQARVTKRTKYYDQKCPGLYVSVTPAGVATFSLKYTCRNTHRRCTLKLGIYHPEAFGIEKARAKAYDLRAKISRGEDVAQSQRQAKALQAKLSGVTVDQIIDERIEWMSTLVKKADGEMRPRIESWKAVASHLNRFVSPRLGKKIASEVTKHDIATLSNDIVAGQAGQTIGCQCPPHAPRRVGDVRLGSRSWTRLCLGLTLH